MVGDVREKMSTNMESNKEPIFPAPPPAVAHAITREAMMAATNRMSAYSVVACPRERDAECIDSDMKDPFHQLWDVMNVFLPIWLAEN